MIMAEAPHILLVPHRFLPARGGVQTVFACAARALGARGVTATVLTTTGTSTGSLGWPGQAMLTPGDATVEGVHVVRLALRYPGRLHRTIRRAARRLLPESSAWPLRVKEMGPDIPDLASTVERLAPDLVVGAGIPFRHVFELRRITARLRIPYALLPCHHAAEPGVLDTRFGRDLVRSADALLALTQMEATTIASWGVAPERITVLPLGGDFADEPAVDAAAPAAAVLPRGPYALVLGRISPQKNVPLALLAFARVAGEFPDLKLVLAGGSTPWSKKELPGLVRTTCGAAADRVVVIPDFAPEAKRRLIEGAVALVHPSHEESFGIVFLEAWSCGRPVIGIRAGVIPEIVHDGETGLLVPRDDDAALAAALSRLAREPGTAQAMGLRGRERLRATRGWDGAAEVLCSLAGSPSE